MKTVFFTPLGNGSRWGPNEELRYMLRSLQDNWTNDFEVVVYGDPNCKPDWLTNVTYREFDRFYPEGLAKSKYDNKFKFENFFCVLNKVKQFVLSDDCPEEFIYIYDDTLLLRPQDTVLNYPLTILKYKHTKERHQLTKNQAIRLLGIDGVWDFETHLVRRFRKDKLIELFRVFDFEQMDVPYPLATMYFNYFKGEGLSTPLDQGTNMYKVGLYMNDEHPCDIEATNLAKIEKAVVGKTWMNYNEKGLNCGRKDGTTPLKEWIIKRYINKSRFEL